MEWSKLLRWIAVDGDVCVIWEEDKILGDFFESKAPDLQSIFHGQVIFCEIEAKLMFFPSFFQES